MTIQKTGVIAFSIGLGVLLAGCATVKGTVFKQTDGTYKSTYSGKSERDTLKVIHQDAKLTCKDEESTSKFVVVNQTVDDLTERAAGAKEGFASVAGTALSVLDKQTSKENVRGTLIFKCAP
ncbi:MAG: hypothetical protein FD130_749 [Halothiobacillaceae bacterium]|nr:MAG: hypothetical protein FD130_749 [Halothiobacillaceae bacterium]